MQEPEQGDSPEGVRRRNKFHIEARIITNHCEHNMRRMVLAEVDESFTNQSESLSKSIRNTFKLRLLDCRLNLSAIQELNQVIAREEIMNSPAARRT